MSEGFLNTVDPLTILAGLPLSPEELDALRTQGFIRREARGRCMVYTLRFRVQGKVKVHYLGTDPEVAEQARRELAQVQSTSCLNRALGKLAQGISKKLRRVKAELSPLLEQKGYHFHGQAIRRRR